MNNTRTITRTALGTTAVLLVAGCSPAGPAIDALDRNAAPADTLPAGVTMGDLTPDDLRSVRNLATHNGVRYYVAASANKRTACITGYPENSPNQWFTGCGELSRTDREIVTVSMNGVATAMLVPDNLAATDALTTGYERIHTNIYVAENTGQIPGS